LRMPFMMYCCTDEKVQRAFLCSTFRATMD